MNRKLKVVTVVGTRPEIIRLAECIKSCDIYFEHYLIHTGQNYDFTLNEIFFRDLELREPDRYLNVVGNGLGETIGNIIKNSFEALIEIHPDALLVLGDTNSVLCTIAAKRLKIPIFHMEAGNRCFDQNVPEEINRKISDHISDINLCYTEHSRRNLIAEGLRRDHIFVTGSPLMEVLNKYETQIENSEVLRNLNLEAGKYIVVSSHREENLDLRDNFKTLTDALNQISEKYQMPVIFSTHPRTRARIKDQGVIFNSLIRNIDPLGYFDYVHLQKNAYVVLSDSGTISEEAAMLGFPAVSIRTSTERPEAVDAGTIVLGGIDVDGIMQSIEITIGMNKEIRDQLPFEYKIDNTSNRVVRLIQSYTSIVNQVIWNKE